jgi:2-amino-4-hydroxy-6-hydroxymethyldihydropteridine diphosphokinase
VTKTVRAFLGLGSNLGDSRELLRRAVGDIAELVAVSPVYETEPVGGPEQGVYLNVVVQLATRRSPYELLALCHDLETQADRVREIRWGPRTLDVDVVYIDGVQMDDPDLTVPHPRAHERNFVIRPLLDLDPALLLDGYNPTTAIGDVRKLGAL